MKPLLNSACPYCGKRRHNPKGPSDGHVDIETCAKCAASRRRRADRVKALRTARNQARARAKNQ